jgi:chromosome segregation ATPase
MLGDTQGSASEVGSKASYSYVPSRMKASSTELRDLHATCDKLRKEIERKDSRIESLIKETQNIRGSHNSQQRELKVQAGAVELLQEERQRHLKEIKLLKKQLEEYRDRNNQLSDSSRLANHIETLKDQISNTEVNLSSLKAEIHFRDERIRTLEYELDVAYRSLAVQNRYENQATLPAAAGSNREKLRSLYFEIGKIGSDNHSLTLALANAEQVSQQQHEKMSQLTKRLSESETALKTHTQTITDLTETLSTTQAQNHALESELHAMKRELSKTRTALAEALERADLAENLGAEVTAEKDTAEQSNKSLLLKLRALEEEKSTWLEERVAILETVSSQRESIANLQPAVDEIMSLRASIERYRSLEEHLKQEILREKSTLHLVQHQRCGLEETCNTLQTTLSSTEQDRDQLAEALTKAMSAIKDLQSKLQVEYQKRVICEQALQSAEQARNTITSSITQALHYQRLKSTNAAPVGEELSAAGDWAWIAGDEQAARHVATAYQDSNHSIDMKVNEERLRAQILHKEQVRALEELLTNGSGFERHEEDEEPQKVEKVEADDEL